MTDAQKVVEALEAADTLLGQAHAAWDWRGADATGEPQGESYQCFLAASEKVEDALPIAREMAERERELVAALERIVTTNDCDCYWSHFAECASEIARVALDRARAAGVEVTGHE